ncbi:recombinase family protein [Anaerosolibacter sp.]|uniref:recombinase family protein n=1 Tax=Anaerosolibacter sp. TaxID=1872527 RepID=UPI0039EEC528
MRIGVGYIRMSTDHQQASPDVQRNIIEDYAAANDIRIIKWYEDLGISGGSLDKRESMLELIFDAEKKLFDIVLFFKYDRVFRNVEEQSIILNKFEKLGIEYKGIKDPEGEGASGKLIRNILGAINQFERELTGERIFYHNRQRRKDGKWTGGSPPLGYDYSHETKTLVINPQQAEIAILIKDLYLELQSCGKVAMELRKRGILSQTGLQYNNETVSFILRNPVYIGKLRWNYRGRMNNEMEVFEGSHEAIWTEEEYNAIQIILDRNKYNNFSANSNYLLSTLMWCVSCGRKMKGFHGGNRKKIRYTYRCRSNQKFGSGYCDKTESMRCEVVDPIVYDRVLKNIKNANFMKITSHNQTKGKNIDASIDKLMKMLEKEKNLYRMDLINEIELQQKTKDIMNQISELKLQEEPKSINDEMITLLTNFEYVWENANDSERKELIVSIVDKIMVHDRYDFTIHYKNFGIEGWNLEERITVPVDKKWISQKELERLLKEHTG